MTNTPIISKKKTHKKRLVNFWIVTLFRIKSCSLYTKSIASSGLIYNPLRLIAQLCISWITIVNFKLNYLKVFFYRVLFSIYLNIVILFVFYVIIVYYNVVFAEGDFRNVNQYDDSSCVIENEPKRVITMSNGTEFQITTLTEFDKVFNEFNAPGYWTENELITNKEIFTMTKHVPILPVSDKILPILVVEPDGNLHSEHTSNLLSSQEIRDNQLLEMLSTLTLEEKALEINKHLFFTIFDTLTSRMDVQGTITQDCLIRIVYEVLYDSCTRHLWTTNSVAEMTSDPLIMGIMTHNSIMSAETEDPLSKLIFIHINTQIDLFNHLKFQTVDLEEIYTDSELYNVFFNIHSNPVESMPQHITPENALIIEPEFYDENTLLKRLQNQYKISEAEFYGNNSTVEQYIEYLNTLERKELTNKIISNFMHDIDNRIENLAEKGTTPILKDIITKAILEDHTNTIWLSRFTDDLTDKQNILRSINDRLSELIATTSDITKKEIMKHLKIQIYLRCTENANNANPLQLISNPEVYKTVYDKYAEIIPKHTTPQNVLNIENVQHTNPLIENVETTNEPQNVDDVIPLENLETYKKAQEIMGHLFDRVNNIKQYTTSPIKDVVKTIIQHDTYTPLWNTLNTNDTTKEELTRAMINMSSASIQSNFLTAYQKEVFANINVQIYLLNLSTITGRSFESLCDNKELYENILQKQSYSS